MIDLTQKWCVYKTSHPSGFYYLGKGITARVVSGAYKGSGTKLVAAFLHYPSDQWTATVLETFPAEPLIDKKDPGEKKAYNREREIITFEILTDPFCLNSMAGGCGGWKWKQLSKAAIKKRGQAVSKALKGQVRGPQKQSTIDKRAAKLRTPEVAAKLGHSKGKKLPHHGLAVSNALKRNGTHDKVTCTICSGQYSKVHIGKHQLTCVLPEAPEVIEARIAENKRVGYLKVGKKVAGANNGTAVKVTVDGVEFGCSKHAVAAFAHEGIKHLYQLVQRHRVTCDRGLYVYENRQCKVVPL